MRRKGSKRSKDPVQPKRKIDSYSVNLDGDIVTKYGGVLYHAGQLAGLSHKAKDRLASIHSGNSDIDYEHAEAVLKSEGLVM